MGAAGPRFFPLRLESRCRRDAVGEHPVGEVTELSRAPTAPIVRRVQVMGSSNSGKSTLARRLAEALNADFVELDALNWLPDWVGLNETNPDELLRRIEQATYGDAWVVAGNYSRFTQRVLWPRLDTVIWLDLPLPLLLWRALRRSWQRARTKELLWGTNVERFWPQLAFWRKENSLVYWIVTNQRRWQKSMCAATKDPRWAHIRFVTLGSAREIDRFAAGVEAECGR